MKYALMLAITALITACASSPYTYHVEPTPLKNHETAYFVSDVKVNLSLGHGADPANTQFADQDELQAQFRQYLEASLKEQGLLASNKEHGTSVIVNIDYKRTFNHGGKALNKPQVSHHVVISDENQKLASFSAKNYTTNHGTFGEAAVSVEIAAFNWDQEDEPKDIELISKSIIKDLVNAGS
ncbi:hypothetical protein L1D52_06140 [Vibrio brasiliensis]|uniref:hypothetical protein n=1 Tax=Vibrio brasiliensis TaxID=170652 RepID=UPI001EFD4BD9|nr:hypothetical protein [Vibrio brasiliensis]MCG9781930.1 hypothetical protein [Vibrio brasiliensis]